MKTIWIMEYLSSDYGYECRQWFLSGGAAREAAYDAMRDGTDSGSWMGDPDDEDAWRTPDGGECRIYEVTAGWRGARP